MNDIVDLKDRLYAKKIEENTAKNERYVIRNELVKCINMLSNYDLEKYDLIDFKASLVDSIIKLNIKIAKDNGYEESKIPPNY
jgi:hypothetical protein